MIFTPLTPTLCREERGLLRHPLVEEGSEFTRLKHFLNKPKTFGQDGDMALAKQLRLSVEDYLQGELVSEIKYEYINGEVFAMVGVKRAHDIVTTNLIAFLHAHLRGTPCRVHSGEMKVRVQTAEDDCFFYPDIHVTCSAADTEELFNSQPKQIIEILSDTTERYDRAD